jgi:hypothetical protein
MRDHEWSDYVDGVEYVVCSYAHIDQVYARLIMTVLLSFHMTDSDE